MRHTFLAVLLAFGSVAASAQGDDKSHNITLQANQLEIRDALKLVFSQTGYNYTVDADVQGSVTATIKDVSFETALRLVLRQVKATYRLSGGIYEIVMPAPVIPGLPEGEESAVAAPGSETGIWRYPVMHGDPWFIVMMLQGNPPQSPEWSTVNNIGGYGNGQGGFGQGFGNGFSQGGNQGFNQGPGGNSPFGGGNFSGRGPGQGGNTGFPGGNSGFQGGNNRGGNNRGMSAGGGQSGGGFVGEDYQLLINPADNTIWFVPRK